MRFKRFNEKAGGRTLAAALLGMGLVAVGCSSNSGGGAASPSANQTTTAIITPSPTGGSTGSGKTVTLDQGPGGAFVFSPKTFSVKQGQTIDVKNVSSTAHTFTISGKGINVVNSAGQSQKVKITLPPGTYKFLCTFHQSLGMVGTLTVT